MTKEEKALYENKKPVAVYTLSNWGGLEILDIINGIDDYVVVRFNFGNPGELHKVKIRYGKGSANFRVDGHTISLADCVRV